MCLALIQAKKYVLNSKWILTLLILLVLIASIACYLSYEINLYDAPSLFAGKIHAVLCRAWKNRTKGRDLLIMSFFWHATQLSIWIIFILGSFKAGI